MLLLGEHILYVQLVKPHPQFYIYVYMYMYVGQRFSALLNM